MYVYVLYCPVLKVGGDFFLFPVNKAKNLLLLTVDGMNAPAGTGAKGSSEINSNDPMYIGGVPGTCLLFSLC